MRAGGLQVRVMGGGRTNDLRGGTAVVIFTKRSRCGAWRAAAIGERLRTRSAIASECVSHIGVETCITVHTS